MKQINLYIPIWFNSILLPCSYFVYPYRFTFQYGSIQSAMFRSMNIVPMFFTFQYGSIQSIETMTPLELQKLTLHSNMVQFNPCSLPNKDITLSTLHSNMVQFNHYITLDKC